MVMLFYTAGQNKRGRLVQMTIYSDKYTILKKSLLSKIYVDILYRCFVRKINCHKVWAHINLSFKWLLIKKVNSVEVDEK